MRTTLDIDDDMVRQLMQFTGEESHSAAINHALQAFLRQMRKQKLLAMRGQVAIADDWQTLRELEKAE